MTFKDLLNKLFKRCALFAFCVLTFSLLSSSSVYSVSYLYWTDQNQKVIKRSNLDGSNIETVLSSLSNPLGIEVDNSASKIYWADSTDGAIKRANFDGTSVETVLSGITPNAFSLDVVGGKFYFTNSSDLAIKRANFDGTSVETIFTSADANSPLSVEVDTVNNKVYFSDLHGGIDTHEIKRSNLDGTSVETIVTGVLDLPGQSGLALDLVNNKVYWTIANFFSDDFVKRANLDGTNVETVINTGSVQLPRGIEIDESAGKIYIGDNGQIRRSNLDGSSLEILTSDPTVGWDVALAIQSLNTATGTNIVSTFDSTTSYLGDNTTLLADAGDIAITYDQVNTEGNTNVAFGQVNVNQTALTAFLDDNWNFFPISDGGEGIVYEFSKSDGLAFDAGVTITVKVDNSVTLHGLDVNDLVGAYLKGDGTFEIIQGTYTPGNQTFSFDVPTGSFSGFGVAVNPEPSTFFLIGTGLLGLWRQRQRFFK